MSYQLSLIPNFEQYVGSIGRFLPEMPQCSYQCLTNCPSPDSCYWDDPLIGKFDLVQYPLFDEWRFLNEHLVRPEPEDPYQTRCPRCYSTDFHLGYPFMVCRNCGYEEPLIDFPISESWYCYFETSIGALGDGS